MEWTQVISRPIRREVLERDQRQCSYVSADGRRCQEKHGIQIDHIVPFALGGGNGIDNLRVLCPSHNRLMAEEWFGKDYVRSRIK
jgi:5-methylcytosine-specific restriction endonuclease McrA